MERRDREVAQCKIAKLEETIDRLKAHQGEFEGLQKQVIDILSPYPTLLISQHFFYNISA